MIRMFLILLIALCFGGNVWCAQTLRIGIQETILQGQEKELINETISSLKLKLNRNIEVSEFSSKDLQKAIQNNEVDLFISSTPFFIAEAKSGARDIATLVSDRAFDPNQGLSALVLVKEGANGLNSLADLKDKTVVFNPRYGQETVYLIKGELEQSGKDSSLILNKLTARDESVKELLDDLSQEKLDAVVLPSCLLEEEAEKNEINTLKLRVLNEKNHPNLLCLHSTSLYPSTTFAMLPSVQAELPRKLRLILLGQEAIKGGMYWGTSSDYDSVDRLLRSLDMDAYASERKWTMKNVVNKYWYIFVGFLLLILGLMAHSVRTEALVKKRTAQLQASLKQREKLQVQAAKTEEALGKLQRLGTVSQISSLFAHELRQPLNAIRCYAYSLLKQTMKAGSNLDKEKFASGLEEINEQAQRADEIIQKVRDYVKDKSRDLTQVDLDQILRKTIESFSLGHPDCEIQVQAVSAKVLGDPLEIELIISNLIKNAYEASVGKKTEPQVYLKGERKSGNFQIEVWDNGPQLSEEQLSEISNSSGSTKADGLGLGLSIVKTFVERHGGTLIYGRSPLGGLLVSFNLRLVNGEKGNGS